MLLRNSGASYHFNPRLQKNSNSFSSSTNDVTSSKRRSRKRGSILGEDKPKGDNNSLELFKALRADGTEQSFDEYTASATLSPWVPTPEVVGRRALEIAKCSAEDIHCDLGCGDGRMNFLAINYPYYITKSIGIDNNAELIDMATKRLSKIHPRPDITFLAEDLLSDEFMELNDDDGGNLLGECTLVTMHFVTEGLNKIKPILEKKLNKDCRVVTIGYAMDGWEMSWSEVMLDLPIYLYNIDEQEFVKDYLKDDKSNESES